MDSVSAVVITKNEARNVERCLRSLAPVVDEIVVVDDMSTDGTPEICERLGARVVQQAWLGYGPQKNLGNGLAANDWILSIDADEALDPFLQRAVVDAKARGLDGVYEVSRLNFYYGRFMRHGIDHPDRKIRLFPRTAARWNGSLVHEALDMARPLAVTRLDGHLLHWAYDGIDEQVAKGNRYSTLAAREAFERGVRPSLAKAVLGPVATFVRSYVLKRGFLDGRHGLLVAALHAQATFMKHAKLWDLHRAAGAPAGERGGDAA